MVPDPGGSDPKEKLPPVSRKTVPGDIQPGSRQRLDQLGPEGFARWLRQEVPVLVTDTTLRDAHQSLLATRLRTKDMVQAAPYFARELPQLLSLEAWGGRHFRRRPALFEGGPLGTPGRTARSGAQPLPANVDQGPQDGRVHALSRRGGRCFCKGSGPHRRRYFPHFRFVERHRTGPAGGAGGDGSGQGGGGRHLLHRRHGQPRRTPVHARLLPGQG